MSDPMSPHAAQIRLAQYGERAEFTVATYGNGTAQALHQIALTLSAEVDRLTAELAQQVTWSENRRLRMVAAETDLLNIRGHLSPNGYPRRVPMPLGNEIAPVVEWLLTENERLTAEVADFRANATKLVDGWRTASGEHLEFSKSKVMDETPGMADKQRGRSDQLADCANELADVLNGDDPDGWEHGVGLDVTDAGDRDTVQVEGGADHA
ncbi:hypothetical protein QMK19_03185 [Streptomyces sp. H10-C2]|uniref:hypothetical protein n=1 Tax=unclassified Streptomyces TaxID=2593676 RepID=UPI0024BAC3E5|nr:MULTISPECIES: hypothetical protein [unclassified Streptomyces]MDJ0342189.1 hypothetical protein [Streptomyces sp. PH10-H1]MDJ0368703.1 hypothetical protein [Streptomyces sp. H10-C2]